MDNVLKRCCIALQIGGAAYRIVVERKQSDGIIDTVAGIPCHTDNFAKKVRDVCINGSPLNIINPIPRFKASQCEFKIFILRNE